MLTFLDLPSGIDVDSQLLSFDVVLGEAFSSHGQLGREAAANYRHFSSSVFPFGLCCTSRSPLTPVVKIMVRSP